jgi:hypothetical protein
LNQGTWHRFPGELAITIAGEPFAHPLFQFILSSSKWRFVALAFTETFEALVSGLQGALWGLGGVPTVLRSDNMSAATHDLPSGGRELHRRFATVLEHYGTRSTRIGLACMSACPSAHAACVSASLTQPSATLFVERIVESRSIRAEATGRRVTSATPSA